MIYTVTFNPAIDYVVRLDTPLEVGEVNRATSILGNLVLALAVSPNSSITFIACV